MAFLPFMTELKTTLMHCLAHGQERSGARCWRSWGQIANRELVDSHDRNVIRNLPVVGFVSDSHAFSLSYGHLLLGTRVAPGAVLFILARSQS